MTPQDHSASVVLLERLLSQVYPPPSGEASLIAPAERIRAGYGCSRSADALYIALAEILNVSGTGMARLMTFDRDLPKQAARNAPSVNILLL